MKTSQPIALAVGLCAGMVACGSDHLDVKIRWSDTQQTIDGFGASSAFFGETITNDVADQLFDAKKGIGLSLLRTIIGLPDDILQDGSEPADGTANPIASAPGVVTALQATLRNQGLGDGLDAAAHLEDDQQQERLRRGLRLEQARPRALSGLRELPGGLRRPDGQEQRADRGPLPCE